MRKSTPERSLRDVRRERVAALRTLSFATAGPRILGRRMRLGGVEVGGMLVAELVGMLRDECYDRVADTLQRALDRADADVGLTIHERTAVLDVLDDPPPGLAQLRSALLDDYVWRVRQGLDEQRVG